MAIMIGSTWPQPDWAISGDDAFADQYEEWSSYMTANLALDVELARRADGAAGRVRDWERVGRYPGRTGDRPACYRH